MNTGTSAPRDAKRIADRQQLAWPDLRNGDSGTQISIGADRRNVDALITSNVDVDTMLKLVQSAAKELGLPKTDFLTHQGPSTATVDMEFNDYLVRDGSKTSFTFPIGKLIRILNRSSVLRPVVLYIEGDIEEQVLVTNGQPKPLPVDTPVLLNEKQLDGVSDLRVTAIQAWWSPIAGWIAFLVLIAFIGVILVAPIRLVASIRKIGDQEEPEPTKRSPEEVQAQYDAAVQKQKGKRFGWLTNLWPYLIFSAVALARLPGLGSIRRQIFYGIPDFVRDAVSNLTPAAVILAALFPVVTTMTAVFFIKKRKKHTPPKVTLKASLLWLLLGTAYLLVCVVTIPSLNLRVEAAWIRPVIFMPAAVMFACAAWSTYRESKRSLTVLDSDDPIRLMAKELGNQAGVRVRQVVVKDEDQFVNAFATFFGTIGITRALRDQLPEDEIRAILAHEVGHLKARDVPRVFFQSVGMFALVIGVVWCLERYSPAYRQSDLSTLVTPLICVAILPIYWANGSEAEKVGDRRGPICRPNLRRRNIQTRDHPNPRP